MKMLHSIQMSSTSKVMIITLIHLLLVCVFVSSNNLDYQSEVSTWLKSIEEDLSEFNSLAAKLTWDLSTNPDEISAENAKKIAIARNKWKNTICESKIQTKYLNAEQQRKLYLFCRGPKFSDDMVIPFLNTLATLSEEYNAKICLNNSNMENLSGKCLNGEPDLEGLLKQDLSAEKLEEIWNLWHDSVGPRIKEPFYGLVFLENVAAKNNGYHDISETWQEELEIPNLENVVDELYEEIQPLYVALHAVIRHKLFLKHGPEQIDLKGPIPIHLLGNAWGQDWTPLMNLFVSDGLNLEEKLNNRKLSVTDLVRQAEDFYVSLGLPRMTEKFWKNSIFEQNSNSSVCHGTAANLYSPGDYRMLMCGKVAMEDFYVIHHEMGHIEYYMAYEEQSPIFREGSNTAIHESLGDAVMHGVMTPQHLNRIGLLTDEELFDTSIDLYLLFQQALSKIPEIPFSLLVDKYRWSIFRGEIDYEDFNREYWKLNLQYRGIVPPGDRRADKYFDAATKFHVPDNTPYIRYFLSSIIQMDIFKSFCQLAVAGSVEEVDGKIPLHRCDIYGTKKIGKTLTKMMKKGASIHWTEAMQIVTGHNFITTVPFLEYYAPVYAQLLKYIKENQIYVGW